MTHCSSTWRGPSLAFAALNALAWLAPAAEGAAIAASFVGTLDGSTALVAIVSDGTEFRAYVCDGLTGKPLQTSEWFKGTIAGDAFESTSQSGHARLSVTLSPERARGSVTLAGRAHTFALEPATGDAGFYLYKYTDAAGIELRAGWILLPNGEQRGSVQSTNAVRLGNSDLETGTRPDATTAPSARASLGTSIGAVMPVRVTTVNASLSFSGGCFPSCLPPKR